VTSPDYGRLSGKPAGLICDPPSAGCLRASATGGSLEDAFDGAAFSITAKNIPKWDVSNTDLTIFGGWAQLTTDARRGRQKPASSARRDSPTG